MRPVQALPGSPPGPAAGRSARALLIAVVAVLAVAVIAIGAVVLLTSGDDGGDERVAAADESGFGDAEPTSPTADGRGGLAPAGAEDADPGAERVEVPAGEEDPDDAIPMGEPTGEPSEQTSTTGADVDLIHDGASAAFDDLLGEVGRDAEVVEVVIYDNYLIAEYQDRAGSEDIDRRIWREGVVEDSEPVGFSDDETMWFSPDEVDLAVVPELAEQALDEFAIDGGVVSHVIVDRFFGLEDGGVAIRVYVSHPERGGGGYLLARADGSVVDVVG
jgi:hypothetical protein